MKSILIEFVAFCIAVWLMDEIQKRRSNHSEVI